LPIPPVTSVPPDWYFLGVRPKWAPTLRGRRNRAGSSTAEAKVTATGAPTPGTVISRRRVASPRTIASTARCSTWYSARNASRGTRSIGSITRSGMDWLARNQLADPRREPTLAHLAELETEPAWGDRRRRSSDAQPHVQQFAPQELAPDQ
jgi:hypothetical protein